MAARRAKKKRRPRERRVDVPCVFCEGDKEPTYKDYETLSKFLTDRAKIVGSKRTGLCTKHQRRLTVEIERARHLGLLPFASGL